MCLCDTCLPPAPGWVKLRKNKKVIFFFHYSPPKKESLSPCVSFALAKSLLQCACIIVLQESVAGDEEACCCWHLLRRPRYRPVAVDDNGLPPALGRTKPCLICCPKKEAAWNLCEGRLHPGRETHKTSFVAFLLVRPCTASTWLEAWIA